MSCFVPLDGTYLSQILEIEQMSQPSPWNEAMFRAEIAHPDSYFFLLLIDDCVVAYGGFRVLLGEGEILNLVVAPAMRKKGFGRRMLDYLSKQASEQQVEKLHLEVRASNESAIMLYESSGFVRVGRRPRYYRDGEDALLLSYVL